MNTVLALLLVTSSLCVAQKCIPGDNCKLPDCRCWNDKTIPGGFTAAETPQMVLISFEYGISKTNSYTYQGIFENIKNPNGCTPKGTFFVSKTNTDFTIVKELSASGHEMAMTSPDGFIPQDAEEWLDGFKEMKAELNSAGVPESNIQGCRGPDLYIGGNAQFNAMKNVGLSYDSTCTSLVYTSKSNLLWPYTYDYVDNTPTCTIGSAPNQAFPGKWQFLVADLVFKGQKCASPSACSPLIETSQDAFDMLYEAFKEHLDGGRSPFVLYMDPLWLSVDYQLEGTKQFLDFVRSTYDDTWILTTQQALAWIQNPVKATDAKTYGPWGCP